MKTPNMDRIAEGGVRTEKWKYIHYFEDPEEFELFDLQSDPQEMNNLLTTPHR